MSGLLLREALDLDVIDRDTSHDLYAYDAAVRDRDACGMTPPCSRTFEHLLDDTEFVD
ncbi:hypothetical protein [Xylanimonas ulmi]|uniref:hypothetical protein n=1 Tax=Xylanimonas ulmi TaxID=228973 RepID=UPI0013EEE796|nr:hypothetical protein [Xylanibacterium ulmi]